MRCPVAIAGLLLTVFAAPAFAQAPKCQLVRVAEWEVKFQNGLPIIEGAINGKPIGVLLDTGAFASLITKDAASRLGLALRGARAESMIGIGGESDVHVAFIEELYIGGSIRNNYRVRVGAERPIRGVDFILGDDFFQSWDLEFDYPKGVVRLFQPRNCKDAPLAYWDRNAAFVPMEDEQKIVLPIAVNGRAARALLDSGASSSVISMPFAAKLGITTGSPGVAASSCTGGVGAGLVDTWVAPFDSVTVGDEVIRNAKLEMANLIPELVNISPEVIFGTDFLRTHRVLVSRSQRKVYLTYAGGQVFPATPRLECDDRVRGKGVKEAIAVYDEAIAAAPEDVKALLGRGVLRLHANDVKGALADFNTVLRLQPRNGVALASRAEARARLRDFDGAIADVDAAIANGMRTSAMFVERAHLVAAKGDDAGALKDFESALALDPRSGAALRSRAWLHFGAGRFEEAERDFAAASGSQPHELDAMWIAISRLRRGADPRVGLEQGIAKAKPESWPSTLMALLLERIDFDAAMAVAAAGGKERKGRECEARYYAAERLLAEKKPSDARGLLEKARDDCPRDYIEYREALMELSKLPP
ncbi:MAG TPA: aspartyl protease family protein [Usitatibacter sp.]|nr:aspartyl protease family protein [Usitatibacter sp.]